MIAVSWYTVATHRCVGVCVSSWACQGRHTSDDNSWVMNWIKPFWGSRSHLSDCPQGFFISDIPCRHVKCYFFTSSDYLDVKEVKDRDLKTNVITLLSLPYESRGEDDFVYLQWFKSVLWFTDWPITEQLDEHWRAKMGSLQLLNSVKFSTGLAKNTRASKSDMKQTPETLPNKHILPSGEYLGGRILKWLLTSQAWWKNPVVLCSLSMDKCLWSGRCSGCIVDTVGDSVLYFLKEAWIRISKFGHDTCFSSRRHSILVQVFRYPAHLDGD